ncbi:glycosyltransferase [Verrucomicrobia bacterium]|nr:glycosyltransferase [Verrucomicrobiota bacterium]
MPPSTQLLPPPPDDRVRTDGKFFRKSGNKLFVKGVTYGPFAKNKNGEPFHDPDVTPKDFADLKELGANLIRVYDVPPRWLLDLAEEFGFLILVDVPWDKTVCFLDRSKKREAAIRAVEDAAHACASHPSVFAISVVNEIPSDIARWSGTTAVSEFIDTLISTVKAVNPNCLCTFANYPPTEYLSPKLADFLTFNVYLHDQRPFENYLARLQVKAGPLPLLLGECGIDTVFEGEERQAEILSWQLKTVFKSGLAGAIVYSFSDEWAHNDQLITDWAFGLTRTDGTPKPAFNKVANAFSIAPHFPLDYYPRVSVVVASYNGANTLRLCLDSLQKLSYPNYEVILVDDGSTDQTSAIAAEYKSLRYIRYADNLGLSVARNIGIEASAGEIIAFTDSDCRADDDWLYFAVGDLLNSCFAGIGGHNFLPPDDSWTASAVMASPGGPAHVMLTDRIAEHIPGCNMVFYKWALDEIGGFDPIYRKAGDDVDICWRLQELGYRIGFSHSGFVWHYRRSSVRAYLKQQYGYGEAEALLVRKHPEYFNRFGSSIWHGRIYGAAKSGIVTGQPMIYHGAFGSGLFQTIYGPQSSMMLMFLTSLEYYFMIALPLSAIAIIYPPVKGIALASWLLSATVCVIAAAQAEIPERMKRFLSKPLVAILFFLQPIVRAWARYRGRLRLDSPPISRFETLDSNDSKLKSRDLEVIHYWGPDSVTRTEFLKDLFSTLEKKEMMFRIDAGWSPFDFEIYGSKWSQVQLTTVAEAHRQNKQLIRCRLTTGASLLGKISLSILILGSVISIGRGEDRATMFAGGLLAIFLFIWLLREEQRKLQRIIALTLDTEAAKKNMVKIEPRNVVKKSENPTDPPNHPEVKNEPFSK